MHLFRRRATVPKQSYEKNSVEINVSADGESSVTSTSVQLSSVDFDVKIDKHVEQLSEFYNAQAGHDDGSVKYQETAKKLASVQRSITSAQYDKTHKFYTRCFLNIAEGYEYCATITPNAPASFDGWDAAWNVLNRDALEAVLAVSRDQKDLFLTSYADLLFARGRHCLRETFFVSEPEAQNGYAQVTARMFYSYLLYVNRLNLGHWQVNDAIKNIHVAIAYGAVTAEELSDIQGKLTALAGQQAAGAAMAQVIKSVNDYVFTETDRQRLQQMVY